MVTAYFALLAFFAAERLFELYLSRRNAAIVLREGGIELGASHLRWMRLLHVGFLLSCGLEVVVFGRPFDARLAVPMLAVLLVAQVLRYWSIVTLGRRWNVRVIVIPGAPVVTSGPYRWLRHPNYLAVVLEIFALPLVHGAWLTALVFSLLNAWMLHVRIGVEERALGEHCGFDERLGDRPLILPARGSR